MQRRLVLDLQALGARHSFPPAKDLVQYQHVMRSLSDSHLCLRLLAHRQHPHSFASTPASCPASCPAAPPPVLLADLADLAEVKHPLRRARATSSLLQAQCQGEREVPREEDEDRMSADTCSSELAADWWDSDYVQHWLRLDETRSALQQQHRQALELDYDQAEMEDWSMSLSCEDLSWRRARAARASTASTAPPPEPPTCAHPHPQLPSIQVGECGRCSSLCLPPLFKMFQKKTFLPKIVVEMFSCHELFNHNGFLCCETLFIPQCLLNLNGIISF